MDAVPPDQRREAAELNGAKRLAAEEEARTAYLVTERRSSACARESLSQGRSRPQNKEED